jgi:hypothetical protein
VPEARCSAAPSIRTSATDPPRIDAVAAPFGLGRMGMTICPGKRQRAATDMQLRRWREGCRLTM